MSALLFQGARFGAVGGISAVVHISAAWLAHQAEAPPFLANSIGFLCAFACSYLGHFYWTFGQREGHRTRLPRFLVVSGAGFALSNLIVWAVVEAASAPFNVALALILLIVPPTTWLLSRFWAFR